MNYNTPAVSFIGIVDFSGHARWKFLTSSVSDLLGFEPHELLGKSAFDFTHPDEIVRVRQMHYETVKEDKSAALAYIRCRHKDPYKGYILCAVTRSVVHNVVVVSISFASSGAKAMLNASTAQEISIISPSAKDFEFRRWNDSLPVPPDSQPTESDPPSYVHLPSPEPSLTSATYPSTCRSGNLHVTHSKLASSGFSPKSIRTALILDRFTVNSTIIYCSNDNFVSTIDAVGRSFFDFVSNGNEALVRAWIDMVKGWGVNERGQPSDGGFGYGKFVLCPRGRDSSEPRFEGPISRRKTASGIAATARSPFSHSRSPQSGSFVHSRSRTRVHGSSVSKEEIKVDVIFSAHSDGVIVILRRAV